MTETDLPKPGRIGRHCAICLTAIAIMAGAAALLAPSHRAPAQDEAAGEMVEAPLTGAFVMVPKLGADQGAPADRILMYVEGQAAETMWNTMTAPVMEDQCIGRQAKSVGALTCYGPNLDNSPADPAYECHIGIDLNTATIELTEDC